MEAPLLKFSVCLETTDVKLPASMVLNASVASEVRCIRSGLLLVISSLLVFVIIKSRCIVGVVSVSKEWYTDKEDGAIDIRVIGEMRQMVDLKEMKGEDELLSVVPVSKKIWDRICELGGGYGLEDECKDD
ncbi:hypothetical protein ACHQM5_011094 [Ranunculus cassubicifolius]